MEKKRFLETGKIINTHGVGGELKVLSLCNSPCDFLKIGNFFWDGEGKSPCKVTGKRLHGDFPLIKVEGINDVQTAALRKNRYIYSPREEIPCPEGEHFIADIVGLPVFDAGSGKLLGHVSDVIKNTPQTVYEIETGGAKALVPAVDEFIKRLDVDEGVFIAPIEGMFGKE